MTFKLFYPNNWTSVNCNTLDYQLQSVTSSCMFILLKRHYDIIKKALCWFIEFLDVTVFKN